MKFEEYTLNGKLYYIPVVDISRYNFFNHLLTEKQEREFEKEYRVCGIDYGELTDEAYERYNIKLHEVAKELAEVIFEGNADVKIIKDMVHIHGIALLDPNEEIGEREESLVLAYEKALKAWIEHKLTKVQLKEDMYDILWEDNKKNE